MRFTTQWRTAFRVKSFKAIVIRERQTKPRAFITGLLTRERKTETKTGVQGETETKTGVQGETETKTFCLNYPRVDHLSRLSLVPGEITGQHKDSNLLFCIMTCYCDRKKAG